jgi:hypothetical protein
MDYLAYAVAIGVGATAVMDIWAAARKRPFDLDNSGRSEAAA